MGKEAHNQSGVLSRETGEHPARQATRQREPHEPTLDHSESQIDPRVDAFDGVDVDHDEGVVLDPIAIDYALAPDGQSDVHVVTLNRIAQRPRTDAATLRMDVLHASGDKLDASNSASVPTDYAGMLPRVVVAGGDLSDVSNSSPTQGATMPELKPWYQSKTIISSLITVVVSMLGVIGVGADAIDQDGLANLLIMAITGITGIASIVFRIVATSQIGPADGGPPSSARLSYCLLLVVGLLAVGMTVTGCATLDAEYVAADKAIYESVAPDYLNYLARDTARDTADVRTQKSVVEAWRLQIEAAGELFESQSIDGGGNAPVPR
jgi:hypothetical protein